MKAKKSKADNGAETISVESHFLDSGAHSLYNKYVRNGGGYAFYETPEFWKYVDDYAAFVKKYAIAIDYYANVDVIFNPEKTWEVQQYLERKHGLRPVPVVHYGTPLKWLHRYIDAGHDFIGIGGIGQTVTVQGYRGWADRVFEAICPPPSYLPQVRTHGFAMTAYSLIICYPWWSVDSATWTKVGAFGGIMVPHKRRGRFDFGERPYVIAVSEDSPAAKEYNKHYRTMRAAEQAVVDEWLAEIGVPLGVTRDGEVVEEGVTNQHSERRRANLLFFERMRASLPEYPWPFRSRRRKGFGVVK